MRISDWSSDVCSSDLHSTFFGPLKYAILPQHLEEDEVLAGTGWVEAGTYIAILGGTIVGGLTPPHIAIPGIVVVAVIGRLAASSSAERRGGKAGVRTCSTRWAADP